LYSRADAPHASAGFQKKITVKQLKATTVLACKCGNTFLVNGRCRNCEAQAIVDKAKQRGDKNFNFEQAIKQQNHALRKEATIEAGQRAQKLSMVADADLPYTGRIQNFIGQSRRDIVEPWEGGAPPG
jgi:predicted GIY-YIG superfamily endonuclease